MYPLKFAPILMPKIWGGHRLLSFKQVESELSAVGESWEISDIPGYESVVVNGACAGKTLHELIDEYKGKLIGESNYEQFGNKFPLLIKLIDAADDLSVQVHPNNELAMKRHHCMGKTEMWYIIENEEGTGHLFSGFRQQLTKEAYKQKVEDNTIVDALARYQVKEGDVYFLPSGRIHAIGAGCLLAEIQQSSDITYRIYDYDRTDQDGHKRELHTELALDALDFRVENDYRTHYQSHKDEPVTLVQCPYFTTSLYDLTQNHILDYSELDSFVVLMAVEGECTLVDNEGNSQSIRAGETVLIPATTERIHITVPSSAKLLEVFV